MGNCLIASVHKKEESHSGEVRAADLEAPKLAKAKKALVALSSPGQFASVTRFVDGGRKMSRRGQHSATSSAVPNHNERTPNLNGEQGRRPEAAAPMQIDCLLEPGALKSQYNPYFRDLSCLPALLSGSWERLC
jgi:hypothetical protein